MSTPVAFLIWTMHPYASIELQSPSDWYLLKNATILFSARNLFTNMGHETDATHRWIHFRYLHFCVIDFSIHLRGTGCGNVVSWHMKWLELMIQPIYTESLHHDCSWVCCVIATMIINLVYLVLFSRQQLINLWRNLVRLGWRSTHKTLCGRV